MKYVYKQYSPYQREEMERWLEKKAAKGWLLKKRNSIFWCFERCEPKQVRFSVVYYDYDEDSIQSNRNLHELDEMCARDGWKRAASFLTMHFYWTDDPNAPELNSDPVLDANSVLLAEREQSKRSRVYQISTVLFFAVQTLNWFVLEKRSFWEVPWILLAPMVLGIAIFQLLFNWCEIKCWYRNAIRGERSRLADCLRIAQKVLGYGMFLLLFVFIFLDLRWVEMLIVMLILLVSVLPTLGMYLLCRHNKISQKASSTSASVIWLLTLLIVMPNLKSIDIKPKLDVDYGAVIADAFFTPEEIESASTNLKGSVLLKIYDGSVVSNVQYRPSEDEKLREKTLFYTICVSDFESAMYSYFEEEIESQTDPKPYGAEKAYSCKDQWRFPYVLLCYEGKYVKIVTLWDWTDEEKASIGQSFQ